jgi:hypothetical protein
MLGVYFLVFAGSFPSPLEVSDDQCLVRPKGRRAHSLTRVDGAHRVELRRVGSEHSLLSKFYWLAVVAMYARMLWTGRVSRYRGIFQFAFAALFAVSFIGIMIDERGSMSMTNGSILNAETPFCQITVRSC